MKRALVLSGGGAKGCWQAGAVLRLHELGNRYDAYFGVSVGGINAAHMAQYPAGLELEAALDMKDLWHNFSNDDVWKHHNFLRWLAVPWKLSVYDTTPLKEFLKKVYDHKKAASSGKLLRLGMVNMTLGNYNVYTGGTEDDYEAIYSSAAYPIMFEMGRFPPPNGDYASDGGLVHVTPLASAIQWGATHIDVITLDAPGMDKWEPPKKKWWQPKIHHVALRTLDVVIQNIIERDLVECGRINRRVAEGRGDPDHRYVEVRRFRPVVEIPVNSLDFDPKTMAKGFELGYDSIEDSSLDSNLE